MTRRPTRFPRLIRLSTLPILIAGLILALAGSMTLIRAGAQGAAGDSVGCVAHFANYSRQRAPYGSALYILGDLQTGALFQDDRLVAAGVPGIIRSPDDRYAAVFYPTDIDPVRGHTDYRLIVRPSVGGRATLLAARILGRDGVYNASALWSPDSRQIAYLWRALDGGTQIGIANADGSAQRTAPVEADAEGGRLVGWSPDGQHIAYTSRVDGRQVLRLWHPASGLEPARTISLPDLEGLRIGAAVWSPDSGHLALALRTEGDQIVYRIIGTDGQDIELGPRDTAAMWQTPLLLWSADSARLFFPGGPFTARTLYRYTLATGETTPLLDAGEWSFEGPQRVGMQAWLYAYSADHRQWDTVNMRLVAFDINRPSAPLRLRMDGVRELLWLKDALWIVAEASDSAGEVQTDSTRLMVMRPQADSAPKITEWTIPQAWASIGELTYSGRAVAYVASDGLYAIDTTKANAADALRSLQDATALKEANLRFAALANGAGNATILSVADDGHAALLWVDADDSRSTINTVIVSETGIQFQRGTGNWPAWSPDSRYFAHFAGRYTVNGMSTSPDPAARLELFTAEGGSRWHYRFKRWKQYEQNAVGAGRELNTPIAFLPCRPLMGYPTPDTGWQR